MNFHKEDSDVQLAEELSTLRRSTRDIVAISALPSVWINHTPSQVADSLAETLQRSLASEFVYVKFSDGNTQIETIFGKNGFNRSQKFQEISEALSIYIETETISPVLFEVSGGRKIQFALTPVGPSSLNGIVIAGCARTSFPSESERLVLNIATNLANVTVQHKLSHEKAELLVKNLENERELRERFVNTLTHDLRTPLNAAKMSAHLLGTGRISNDKKVSLMGRIVDNMTRANQMIENLLDANRINAGKPLSVEKSNQELYSIINHTLLDLITIHGDRFVLTSEETMINGFWNAEAIQRIMENLCANAVKYGDSRSPISINLSTTSTEAVIRVHNVGNPIPPEEQSKLFGSFQRLESGSAKLVRGWGLGLALVKELVEAHDGKISVVSTIEDGTTFSIFLPLNALHTRKS